MAKRLHQRALRRAAGLAAACTMLATTALARPTAASVFRVGESSIWDQSAEDLDEDVNRIRFEPFTPIGLPDVTVRNLTIEFLTTDGEATLTSTSSTVSPGANWHIGVAPDGEAAFEVEFMAPVPPLSAWGFPSRMPEGPFEVQLTTHLHGDYTFEFTVEPSAEPTSHASAWLHAEVVTSTGTLVFPAIEGGLAENTASTFPVAPSDRIDSFLAGENDIQYLRGRLGLDLGPGAGVVLPVSAKLTLRIVPEPAAAATGLAALAALVSLRCRGGCRAGLGFGGVAASRRGAR